jgi:hypothetical protein
MRQDALMFPPELVFIESLPNGSLFDMQDEFSLAFLKLNAIGFNDAGDGIAAGP